MEDNRILRLFYHLYGRQKNNACGHCKEVEDIEECGLFGFEGFPRGFKAHARQGCQGRAFHGVCPQRACFLDDVEHEEKCIRGFFGIHCAD